MSRQAQVVVLCEDLQSRTLLWRYLKMRGYPRHNIRVGALASGAGCGSQRVREQYAHEVRVQRTRHVTQVLVVHMDADNLTVRDRHRELADALAHAGLPPRGVEEPIALVVPKWATETWLHHFLGAPGVAESARVTSKFPDKEASAAEPTAEALLACVQGGVPSPANLPSFATAVSELQRLP